MIIIAFPGTAPFDIGNSCLTDVNANIHVYTYMYSTAREQLSNYSQIFPNIHKYSQIFTNIHIYFWVFLNIFEYFRIFCNILVYILEYSRIKWNDNDLGYSLISWSILEYSQIFTLESCSRAVLYMYMYMLWKCLHNFPVNFPTKITFIRLLLKQRHS